VIADRSEVQQIDLLKARIPSHGSEAARIPSRSPMSRTSPARPNGCTSASPASAPRSASWNVNSVPSCSTGRRAPPPSPSPKGRARTRPRRACRHSGSPPDSRRRHRPDPRPAHSRMVIGCTMRRCSTPSPRSTWRIPAWRSHCWRTTPTGSWRWCAPAPGSSSRPSANSSAVGTRRWCARRGYSLGRRPSAAGACR